MSRHRREIGTCFVLLGFLGAAVADPAPAGPGFRILLDTISKGHDGKTCWVHPRAGTIPGESPVVVLAMQKLLLTGSDVNEHETWVTVAEWMQTWGPNFVIPCAGRE